jgi:hydrogenase expression/formation protein HypD
MKYVDEFRDRKFAQALSGQIALAATQPWRIMEVCGGQTHTILQYGLEDLLPSTVQLLHGPGCPVCVTPLELINKAIAIAPVPDVILCSFGDMLRVPGSTGDLLQAKALGADVRIVYSPLEALNLARKHPDRRVVFFAVGFETTAPANAMAVYQAKRLGVSNFFLLCSHVTVPPVIAAILQAPNNQVQAFLGPGHVCSVMGTAEYEALCRNYRVPIVISGFEPTDLLEGILRCIQQLERGEARVENQYARAVITAGNEAAQAIVTEVFDVSDRIWRGLGSIPKSGYRLSYAFRQFDAEREFQVEAITTEESPLCISGQILRGLKKPSQCPAFGTQCTPEQPLGATMVSSEGTCATYYKFGKLPLKPVSERDTP